MKDFIKKTLYFGLIYNLTVCFFQNVELFQKNQIFRLSVDGMSIIVFIGLLIFSPFFVGIIKLFSIKINKYIYSYQMLGYIAFTDASLDWIVDLLSPSGERGFISYLVIIAQLIFCIFLLYFGWKYRIELSAGIFLGRILFRYSMAENIYQYIFLKMPTDLEEFYLISVIVITFILLTFALRKLNVYDFRSRKDKWQETMGEGPYRRLKQKVQTG